MSLPFASPIIIAKLKDAVAKVKLEFGELDFLKVRKKVTEEIAKAAIFAESEDLLPLMALICVYLETVESITVEVTDPDDYNSIAIDQGHTTRLDVLINALIQCQIDGFTHAVLNYEMGDQQPHYEAIELTEVVVEESFAKGSGLNAAGQKTVLLK